MSHDGPLPQDMSPPKHRPLENTTPVIRPRSNGMRPCKGCGNPTQTEGCFKCRQAHKVHDWRPWEPIHYIGFVRRCRHIGCVAVESRRPFA